MTTLVTGSRGFVGRHLVDQLLAADERVIAYNRDFTVDTRDGVVAVLGELFDIPRLTETLRKYDVDRIIHTAGQSHPGVSIELPITTFAANADGTLAVYEAARTTGVRRIVFFSSECAVGNIDGHEPVTEAVKPAPTTVYGVTKVAGELLGSVYNSLYDMEVVSLRITEVYGPGLWMPSLLGDMIRAGLRGDTFRLECRRRTPLPVRLRRRRRDRGAPGVHHADTDSAGLLRLGWRRQPDDRLRDRGTARKAPPRSALRDRSRVPAELGPADRVRPVRLRPRPRLRPGLDVGGRLGEAD